MRGKAAGDTHPCPEEFLLDFFRRAVHISGVLGAIRMSGRWIDRQVLERLSRRSQGPTPPLRSELITNFAVPSSGRMRMANWRWLRPVRRYGAWSGEERCNCRRRCRGGRPGCRAA